MITPDRVPSLSRAFTNSPEERREILDLPHTAARGRVQCQVIDCKTKQVVREYPWQENLILDVGLDMIATGQWADCIGYGAVGTGNTPTKDLPDGFYTRSGTTVTRESGTRDFIAGDVGKLLRFSDGTESKITVYTNATTVTVADSGTVPLVAPTVAITAATSGPTSFTITAAGHGRVAGDRITIAGVTPSGYNGNWTVDSVAGNDIVVSSNANPGTGTIFGTVKLAARPVILYRVAQTALASQTERSAVYPQFLWPDGNPASTTLLDTVAAKVTFRRTYDFSEQVGSVNYTEVGIAPASSGNLFSRILLSGAVTVAAGQAIRVKYELVVRVYGGLSGDQTTIDGGITGWPRPYNISSITSTGSNFTVTLSEPHHYVMGGKINIANAKRPRTAITVASSTGSDFTITAVAHGRSPGDVVVIEGMTPSAYNGTWAIATVPTSDTFTVASLLNPGNGTVFGNVRQQEPGTWYNGEWTVASVTSTTVVVTSAINPPAAGADGTVVNNLKRKFVLVQAGVGPLIRNTGSGIYGDVPESGATTYFNFVLAGNEVSKPGGSGSSFFYGLLEGTGKMAVQVRATQPTSAPGSAVWPGQWNVSTVRKIGGTTTGSFSASEEIPAESGAPTTARHATEDTYTAGNFYRTSTVTFGATSINQQDIKYIDVGRPTGTTRTANVAGYFVFEEPQRKDSTYKLTLVVRRSWGRDLTVSPS